MRYVISELLISSHLLNELNTLPPVTHSTRCLISSHLISSVDAQYVVVVYRIGHILEPEVDRYVELLKGVGQGLDFVVPVGG